MVQNDNMPRAKPKRFSVSLPAGTYKKLKSLGQNQDPSLSLTYMINFAVNDLIKRAEDPQLKLDFGNPLDK